MFLSCTLITFCSESRCWKQYSFLCHVLHMRESQRERESPEQALNARRNGPQSLKLQGLQAEQGSIINIQQLAGGNADGGGVLWQQQRTPLLECFWQGRLIPGTRIESLPFIEVCTQRVMSFSMLTCHLTHTLTFMTPCTSKSEAAA